MPSTSTRLGVQSVHYIFLDPDLGGDDSRGEISHKENVLAARRGVLLLYLQRSVNTVRQCSGLWKLASLKGGAQRPHTAASWLTFETKKVTDASIWKLHKCSYIRIGLPQALRYAENTVFWKSDNGCRLCSQFKSQLSHLTALVLRKIIPCLGFPISLMDLMIPRVERDKFQSSPCHGLTNYKTDLLGIWPKQSHGALDSESSHAWSLMLCSCCLEILNNFIFALCLVR